MAATLPSRQLLSFGFDANASFQGHLVRALERLESGDALRILEVLFVAADEATGDAVAINHQGGTGLTGKLLDFRLHPAARRKAAKRALGEDAGDGMARRCTTSAPPWSLVPRWGQCLWSTSGREARGCRSRVSGRSLASEFVEAAKFSELPPELLRNLL
jgi:hypothetical protein